MTTDWHDYTRAGAFFRGVPFRVENTEQQGGRRLVVHEYPQRDEVFGEDLGRRGRKFTIEGYVVGADYLDQRDKLLDALETAGPGQLDLPYYKTRQVAVIGFSVRETRADGGTAIFSMEFVETPAKPADPTNTTDDELTLTATVDKSFLATEVEFLAQYNPGPIMSAVSAQIHQVAGAVSNVLATVQMEEQALATVKAKIVSLTNGVADLVNQPANLFAAVKDVVTALPTVKALQAVYASNPGARPPGTTPNRIREQKCFDATHSAVQRLALIQAVQLTGATVFSVYQDAIAARTAMTDLLDEQAELAADDTYPVLLQLRADLVKAVPGTAKDLAQIVGYTPGRTVPSLVAAFNLYGDVALEPDLIARNKVAKPGFLRGGTELQVLSDG